MRWKEIDPFNKGKLIKKYIKAGFRSLDAMEKHWNDVTSKPASEEYIEESEPLELPDFKNQTYDADEGWREIMRNTRKHANGGHLYGPGGKNHNIHDYPKETYTFVTPSWGNTRYVVPGITPENSSTVRDPQRERFEATRQTQEKQRKMKEETESRAVVKSIIDKNAEKDVAYLARNGELPPTFQQRNEQLKHGLSAYDYAMKGYAPNEHIVSKEEYDKGNAAGAGLMLQGLFWGLDPVGMAAYETTEAAPYVLNGDGRTSSEVLTDYGFNPYVAPFITGGISGLGRGAANVSAKGVGILGTDFLEPAAQRFSKNVKDLHTIYQNTTLAERPSMTKTELPHLSFLDYYIHNMKNKIQHPFNAEAIRLLTNNVVKKSHGILTDDELAAMVEKTKKLKIGNKDNYYTAGDKIWGQFNTLDGWSLMHEIGHKVDEATGRNLSLRTHKHMGDYHYAKDSTPSTDRYEFFADLFANNNYPQMPFDRYTSISLRDRLDAIERANITLKQALKYD